MNNKYYPPSHQEKQFHCAYCGVYASQIWNEVLRRQYGTLTEAEGWTCCDCEHCNRTSYWYGNRMVIPADVTAPAPHEDFPDSCRADYDEARDIVARSPKAAAALLRLCLQKLLKVLGEKGDNINHDIASLVQKGLPVAVQQALDYCRIVGNNAVHPGELSLDDTPEIAHALFGMLNFIVDQRITQNKRIEAFYGMLPEHKRAEIEKRDASRTEPAS